MSTRKTLRLRLSALREISVDPYKEAEMLEFLNSLVLPTFVIDNNEGLESMIKSEKMQSEDIFHKYPLLLGMLKSIGIMNEESILEITTKYYDNIAIRAIDVGFEVIKWLWRPVVQKDTNIRVGTALIEYSLVKNILLKLDDDLAFVRRQCYSEDFEISLVNLQLISDRPSRKDSPTNLSTNSQIHLFEEYKDTSKVIKFPIQLLHTESLDYLTKINRD